MGIQHTDHQGQTAAAHLTAIHHKNQLGLARRQGRQQARHNGIVFSVIIGKRSKKREVDSGDSAAFLSIFLVSGFSCSQAEFQPVPPQRQ
jgi:hypothetical protein